MPSSPLPVQSAAALFEVSENGGLTWKFFACITGWTGQAQLPVNAVDTSCGKIIGLGLPAFNPTVQGITVLNPDANELTHKDLLRFMQNKQLVKVRTQSPANGSYAVGAGYYYISDAYVTECTATDAINSPITYSATFSGQGTPIFVAP